MSDAPQMDQIERSESLVKLAPALVKTQAQIKHAPKDSENPHFKSRYADLAATIDACREALTVNGFSVLQPVTAEGRRVRVTTMLLHESGEWISAPLTLTAQQDTPQAVGSAITYGRRYGLQAMVGIAADDDDGNAASDKGPQKPKAASKPQSFREEHGELPRRAAKTDWLAQISKADSWSAIELVRVSLVKALERGEAPDPDSTEGRIIGAALDQKRADLAGGAPR